MKTSHYFPSTLAFYACISVDIDRIFETILMFFILCYIVNQPPFYFLS